MFQWSLRIASCMNLGAGKHGLCEFDGCKSAGNIRVQFGNTLDPKSWVPKLLCEFHRRKVFLLKPAPASLYDA